MSFDPPRDPDHPITRRHATRLIGATMLSAATVPSVLHAKPRKTKGAPPPGVVITPEDIAFLDDMQQRGCLYFAEQASPSTGQVLDRAINKTTTGTFDPHIPSSIAATGFGLTALCIAAQRGYLPVDRVQKQVLTTLDFYLHKLPHTHGFFFHYNDATTGKPFAFSEVSSIDTAIFLCGVLTCRAFFDDQTIEALATELYNRVDWPWMLNGGDTFSMGWHPRTNFIDTRWDHYCELMMLYLLAIGSPTHPVSPASWNNFTRPTMRFSAFTYISGVDPLFVHQYSHAWFDFRDKRDFYANYFTNSVTATRAHRTFLLSLDRGYNDDFWGVSSSDWQHGYTAWGGPPLMGPVDGSVVPCAAAGSLPFAPTDCLRVLRSLKEKYGNDAWGRYGFCDAFHPSQLWYDPDVIGIDLGIGVLMAENLRSGFVWKTFMQNPEPVAAMKAVGFQPI